MGNLDKAMPAGPVSVIFYRLRQRARLAGSLTDNCIHLFRCRVQTMAEMVCAVCNGIEVADSIKRLYFWLI